MTGRSTDPINSRRNSRRHWLLGAIMGGGVMLPVLASAVEWQSCGRGKAEAWGWLDVARIELRRADCAQPWQMENRDQPWRLSFDYLRKVPAKAFRKSAMTILERQLQLDDAERQLLTDFHDHYRDVEKDDQYRLTYLPTQGLTLEFNGERIGHLDDRRLGAAYGAIWLGESPFDQALRQQLLFGAKR